MELWSSRSRRPASRSSRLRTALCDKNENRCYRVERRRKRSTQFLKLVACGVMLGVIVIAVLLGVTLTLQSAWAGHQDGQPSHNSTPEVSWGHVASPSHNDTAEVVERQDG